MTAQLVGLKGTHWGQTLPLGPETTLGRDPANALAFPDDSSVSRRHARIAAGSSGFAIEDVGSSNGTFVNGVRISVTTILNSGDEVALGGQSFRFEMAAPSAPSPPAVPRRPEVSRGEQTPGYARRQEVPSIPDLSGCAAPRLDLPDLSGCLRFLMLMLIALVILLVIGGLLALLSAGFGMLGGTGRAGGGTGASSGGRPPQSGVQDGSRQSGEGIRVISVRIAPVWDSAAKKSIQRVLVTWENGAKKPVQRIWANVRVLDASGVLVGESRKMEIYSGPPVQPEGRHSDLPTGDDGFPVPGADPAATTVEIDPTAYE
jgi:hypothetical protein